MCPGGKSSVVMAEKMDSSRFRTRKHRRERARASVRDAIALRHSAHPSRASRGSRRSMAVVPNASLGWMTWQPRHVIFPSTFSHPDTQTHRCGQTRAHHGRTASDSPRRPPDTTSTLRGGGGWCRLLHPGGAANFVVAHVTTHPKCDDSHIPHLTTHFVVADESSLHKTPRASGMDACPVTGIKFDAAASRGGRCESYSPSRRRCRR